MAPNRKPASAASADNASDVHNRSDNKSADSVSDKTRICIERLHALHARMDEHAKTQSGLLPKCSAETRCPITLTPSTLARLLH
jgi:hypothetical protein